MKTKSLVVIGLLLIAVSQALMSFGYEFLMSQKPIDFAHWALLIGAICLSALWVEMPASFSKKIGLVLMTFGIGGLVGMCVLDFILWAADGQAELKQEIFALIFETASIKYPFLMIGPSLFYGGICVASYGLFKRFTWQVVCLNAGALMIGLGHLILNNQAVPVMGSVLLFIGLISILGVFEKNIDKTD